jgi:hypothetical protein
MANCTTSKPVIFCRATSTLCRRFIRAKDGLAALEFALVLPLLLAIMLGFYEIDRYAFAVRRLEIAAASMTDMLTTNTTGFINYNDIHFAEDSIMVLFPMVLADSAAKQIPWQNDISISISSIVFSPTVKSCTSNCTYTANVAWTTGGRACGSIQIPGVDTSAPSLTTLPDDLFGVPSVVVVDLAYTYVPRVGSSIIKPFTIHRSSYIQPRYIPPTSYLKYSVISGDDGIANACPGY